MKTLSAIFILLTCLLYTQISQAQTAELSGTLLLNNSESQVRSGGNTLIVTLTNEKWAAGMGEDNDVTTAFLNSFTGSSGGDWSTIRASIDFTMVSLLNDSTVNVDLPIVTDYNITDDDTINLLIDTLALDSINTKIPALNEIIILHDKPEILVRGTVNDGTSDTESDVRAGLTVIDLHIKNIYWNEEVGVVDNAATQGVIHAFKGDQGWDTIAHFLNYTHVERVNDSIIRINVPVIDGYYITSDENINLLVPSVSLMNYAYDINAPGFVILNEPESVTLSGTIQGGTENTEADIRAGGSTIIFNISGDEWKPQLGSDEALTQEFINGISNYQGTAWNTFVKPVLTVTDVLRQNKTTLILTLPPIQDYDISSDEIIRVMIPASAMKNGTEQKLASPDLTIVHTTAVINAAGNIFTAENNTENDIRQGLSNIRLIVSEDLWEPAVGDANVFTENLVRGISGSDSWNSSVVEAILGTDQGASNVSLSGDTVIIDIPPVPDYDISENDSLHVQIPASCLQYTASGNIDAENTPVLMPVPGYAVINDPGLDEQTIDRGIVTLTLHDENFITTDPPASAFTVNNTTNVSVASVNYISDKQVELVLSKDSDFDSDLSINVEVSSSILVNDVPLTTNDIPVTAVFEPEITGVAITPGVYGVGDSVQVELNVNDDGGTAYSLSSGTVAGKNLLNLKRLSSTRYYAYILVQEGDRDYVSSESMIVENLQLNRGAISGEVYNGTIILSDVTIDANSPVINYLQAPDGMKIIGDNLDIIVSADGEGYNAIASGTSVNGISLTEPNISFIELGNGVYILRYIVEQGDPDVIMGELTASLVLQDNSGNRSSVATTLTDNNVSVDANAPSITSMTVDDNVYTIGDLVTLSISADGNDYVSTNDSHINGVPLSSSDVTFTNLGGNQYLLQYTVRSVDPEVNPGQLTASVIFKDAAGNISQPFTDIQDNSLAIYTALPSATLIGNQQICEDDSARLIVNLTGRGPWKFYLNNGSGNKEYIDVNYTPYDVYVKPVQTTTYYIDSVIDVNGIKNSGTGIVTVQVNQKADVEIMGLNSSYSIDDDPVTLRANIDGGIFSGPGVISSNNTFDPEVADTLNSPHTIYYTYVNARGCVSIDSALIFVLGAQGDIYIPKTVYCNYNEPFTVSASNSAGSVGSFKLLNASGQETPGLTDQNNNTAIVDPGQLNPGEYTILFEYMEDVAHLSISESFNVETVQQPKIITLDQSDYCQNEPSFRLEGDVGTGVFAGPGVSGNVEDGFIFNPSDAYIGNNKITYTNTTENGCSATSAKTVRINYVPNVNFTVDDVCISPDDSVVFNNTTINKYVVNEWLWNFGDINSGEANISRNESDYHFYNQAGTRIILLVGKTTAGCVDSLERIIEFGNKPMGSLSWNTDCFVPGDSIHFEYQNSAAVPVSNYFWQVFNNSDEKISEKSGSRSIYFNFPDTSKYRIELFAETNLGCSNTFTRQINLKPTIIIDDTPYFEGFEDGNGQWSTTVEDGSGFNSWKYGIVDFNGLNESSSTGWYTELPLAEVTEKSYLVSPCFNMQNLERPMIRLNYLQSLDANREGVVLQTSVDNGKSWQNLGSYEDGINWFNSYQISNKPGGQDIGWTGKQPFNPDENWVEARHQISNELLKSQDVRFRFAFASAHDSKEAREGFAIDEIWIGNRSRKILLEHFTNVTDPDALKNNATVNWLYVSNFYDIVKLEFHTEFPGEDPLNKHNKAVPATRSLFYGISDVPYTVIDGGAQGDMHFDYVSSTPDESDINLKSLQDPKFEIELNTSEYSDHVNVNVTITALDNLTPQERIIHIAVYEKLIELEAGNGENKFLNVVKAMLPNAAGNAIFNGWSEGESRSYSYDWYYNNVFDPEMIRVAVFVQNDITKEVYQATTNDSVNITTSRPDRSSNSFDLKIYPNPADNELNLYLQKLPAGKLNLAIYDQLGRMVLEDSWYPAEKLKTLDISILNKGIYFIRISDEHGRVNGIQKLMVID